MRPGQGGQPFWARVEAFWGLPAAPRSGPPLSFAGPDLARRGGTKFPLTARNLGRWVFAFLHPCESIAWVSPCGPGDTRTGPAQAGCRRPVERIVDRPEAVGGPLSPSRLPTASSGGPVPRGLSAVDTSGVRARRQARRPNKVARSAKYVQFHTLCNAPFAPFGARPGRRGAPTAEGRHFKKASGPRC